MGIRRRLGRLQEHYDPDFTFASLSLISGSVLSVALVAWLASQGLFPAWLLPVLLVFGLFVWLGVGLYLDSRDH